MEVEFIKDRIKDIKKRLDSGTYKISSYLSLTNKNKRAILDDFEFIIETIYYLNKIHLSNEKWWNKNGQEFVEPFTAFWLSRYLTLIYLNRLNYDKIVYSFLTDDLQGKKNILEDLERKMYSSKEIKKISIISEKAEKIEECKSLLKAYKIILDAASLGTLNRTQEGFMEIARKSTYLLSMPLDKMKSLRIKRFIKRKQMREIVQRLEKGDLILFRYNNYNESPFPSFWNNAGIYAGSNKIFEISENRIKLSSIRKISQSDHVCILRPKISLELRERSVEILRKKEGISEKNKFALLMDRNLSLVELFIEHNSSLNKSISTKNDRGMSRFNFISLFNEKKLDFVYYLYIDKKTREAVIGSPKDLSQTDLKSKWDAIKQ